MLSLDLGVQQAAEQALQHAIDKARATVDRSGSPDTNPSYGKPYRADGGAVVVVEARTGRVVALASAPTYDPSVFVGGIGQEAFAALTVRRRGDPLVSRAMQGEFAPGSTFKLVSRRSPRWRARAAPLGGRYDCPGVGQGRQPASSRTSRGAASPAHRPAHGAGEVVRHDLLPASP